jgi:hypothetical protein
MERYTRCSSRLATMLPWVSSAPLGAPVVPEVYCRRATSSRWRGWLSQRRRRAHDGEEVVGAGMSLGGGRERGWHGEGGRFGEVVAVGGHGHRLDRRVLPDRLEDAVSLLRRHQEASPGVQALLLDLPSLVHRVEADVDAAGLEGAEVGDGELRAVLEVQHHAVARPEAARAQPAREAVGGLVQLAEADLPPVEDEARPGRIGPGVALQHDGNRIGGQPDRGLVESRRPVTLPDLLHRRRGA